MDSSNNVHVALETTEEEMSSEKSSDWLPLDVCFGVPLFDSKLSSQVCERVRMYSPAFSWSIYTAKLLLTSVT